MNGQRSIGGLAVVAAMTLAAACSGHGAHTGAPPSTSSQAKPSNGGAAGIATSKAIDAAHVKNDVKLRKNVVLSSCTGDKTSWHAAGTAHNATSHDIAYRLTVFYTTPKATDVGSSATTITVPAKGDAKWSTTAKLKSGGTLRCVLVGVAAV